jgi:hypothetical protein
MLNSSRLSKEFSVNVFYDLFNQEGNLSEYKNNMKNTTEFSNYENHKNQGSDGGSVFGLLDMNPSNATILKKKTLFVSRSSAEEEDAKEKGTEDVNAS